MHSRGCVDDLLAALFPVACPAAAPRRAMLRALRGDDARAARCAAPRPARLVGRTRSRTRRRARGRRRARSTAANARSRRVARRSARRRGAAAPLAFDVVTWAPASRGVATARGWHRSRGAPRARSRPRARRRGPSRMLARAPGRPQTGRRRGRARGPGRTRESAAVGADRRVLVVDDVGTTGGTLAAATRALRQAGAASVITATIARTPRPGSGRSRRAYTAGVPSVRNRGRWTS